MRHRKRGYLRHGHASGAAQWNWGMGAVERLRWSTPAKPKALATPTDYSDLRPERGRDHARGCAPSRTVSSRRRGVHEDISTVEAVESARSTSGPRMDAAMSRRGCCRGNKFGLRRERYWAAITAASRANVGHRYAASLLHGDFVGTERTGVARWRSKRLELSRSSIAAAGSATMGARWLAQDHAGTKETAGFAP